MDSPETPAHETGTITFGFRDKAQSQVWIAENFGEIRKSCTKPGAFEFKPYPGVSFSRDELSLITAAVGCVDRGEVEPFSVTRSEHEDRTA